MSCISHSCLGMSSCYTLYTSQKFLVSFLRFFSKFSRTFHFFKIVFRQLCFANISSHVLKFPIFQKIYYFTTKIRLIFCFVFPHSRFALKLLFLVPIFFIFLFHDFISVKIFLPVIDIFWRKPIFFPLFFHFFFKSSPFDSVKIPFIFVLYLNSSFILKSLTLFHFDRSSSSYRKYNIFLSIAALRFFSVLFFVDENWAFLETKNTTSRCFCNSFCNQLDKCL